MRPSPASASGLLSLNIQDGLGICPLTLPEAFSLRARGEEGPANLVTAYASVRLAAAFLEEEGRDRPSFSHAGPQAASPRNAVILAPSPSQARLARELLRDFGKASLRVLAGEPGDFEGFPKASLVILDTALGGPHASHPWAKGPVAAKAVLQALTLAGGALVLLGPEARLASLPKDGPLGLLYGLSADKVRADRKAPFAEGAFQEALERAALSVFCAVPPLGRDWWRSASPAFHAAARRGAEVTLFTAPPDPADTSHPEEALRGLRLSGSLVMLAEGFPGLTATVDRRLVFWGDPQVPSGAWKSVCSIEAPRAAAVLEDLLQLPLLRGKLGPGSPRNCPLCGWPFLLHNQDRARGFGDANALKLGCLNPACDWGRAPRALHERWPYAAPPVCREDGSTRYVRERRGKREYWVCPNHDGGPCPRSRVVPGDPPGKK